MAELNDNLDAIQTARDNIKTALAGKGQIVTNDIRTYANAVSNISGSENLEPEMTNQETYISQLEAIIDQKISKGSGNTTLNIFTQLTEPTTKKGIWLQTDKQTQHCVYDNSVTVGGDWSDSGVITSVPFNFYSGSAVTVGTDIYIFGGINADNYKAYKYDTLTNTYTRLTDTPSIASSGTAVAIGTDIYLFESKDVGTCYKYDTLTDTYTNINTPSTYIQGGSSVAIGTDVYIFGSSGTNIKRRAYKYNTLTNTYTSLNSIPYDFYEGSVVAVDGVIYLLGGNASLNYIYKYDLDLGTYTSVATIPYDFCYGSAIAIRGDIYLIGGANSKQSIYKYSLLDDVFTKLSDIPYDFYEGSASNVGTDIYIFGSESTPREARRYSLQDASYSTDNTVVIERGTQYNADIMDTSLFEENYQPLQYFKDVYFYTTQDGLDGTIPTYYGDGTQWINFKNPPSNNNE